jgi:uncharacterized YigZ family protein
MDHYQTIEKSAETEFKERGSRFIAYAFPVADTHSFKKRLGELKKEHAKATHHCFAYRIGVDGNIFRVSDDGEPSGTAGKPILGQIDSKSLTDIAVIVVRYFGGTLLGVPGLINAYKTVTAYALQLTPVIQKQIESVHVIEFDYTRMNDIMTVIKETNCTVIEKTIELFCKIKIGIPKKRLVETLNNFNEIPGIEIKPFENL